MIDVNEPVTNPALVAAMEAFFTDRNVGSEGDLIQAIKDAHFLTPMILDGKIEEGVMKAGGTISFKMITNQKDEHYFLAFTDWAELGKWSAAKEETLITTYADLEAMVMKDSSHIRGFVINPYTQNLIISQELMAYFQSRITEMTVKKDTKVRLGQPAQYPTDMVRVLCDYFKTQKNVDRAYLFLAHREDEPRPQLLLIMDFEGDKDKLFPHVARIAQPFLHEGDFIDMTPLTGEFALEAVKTTKAFYQKKRFGLF